MPDEEPIVEVDLSTAQEVLHLTHIALVNARSLSSLDDEPAFDVQVAREAFSEFQDAVEQAKDHPVADGGHTYRITDDD